MNCTGCGVLMYGFYYLCDQVDGWFCDQCIDDVAHCDEYPEDCVTAVFEDTVKET